MLAMYLKDLSLIDREVCLRDNNLMSLAIGWLSNKHEFNCGVMEKGFINRLWQFCRYGTVLQTLGYHECELCIEPAFGCVEQYQDTEQVLGS